MRYGGDILVGDDPLPAHAQVAVVLDGPTQGVAARWAAALSLLQQRRVDHVMVSVGRIWLWGKWFPDLVEGYVKGTYGEETARRVVLCKMNTDSTVEEAWALRGCLKQRGWRSVLVVTSDYHSRRARHIWRKVLGAEFTLSVYGVLDDDFDANGWWRNRHYTRTWFYETTKLVCNYLTGS